MKKKYTKIILPIATSIFLSTFAFNVFAGGDHKVTICHATSSETNPFVRIVVDRHAIGGHFYNNGTPLAGHEDDILIEGIADCPSPKSSPHPTPSVKPSPTPSPSVTPSPTPSPTPTVVPSPTPTTGGNSQEQSQTQTNNQTVNVTVTGQVAGVKTPTVQPETGVSTLAFATMFGAAPFGILLRRFSKTAKREESLAEFASTIVREKADK